MKQIPYILTDESLTIVIGGKAQIMNNDHPKWQQANAALEAEEGWRVHSFAPDVKDNGGWQKVLFEREVN